MFVKREVLTQDVFIAILLLVTFLLGGISSFLKDWTPLLLFYYAYEFTRGHLSGIQTLLHITVNNTALYNADKFIFGNNLPVILAQRLIQPQLTIIDYISFVWYTSFFWFPIVSGYILWVKDRKHFKFFRNSYLILCFMALFTFLVFPAAPPWMASQLGILPALNTNTWSRFWGGQISIGLFNFVGYNLVAPFPSLHVGWAVLGAYIFQGFTKKKIKGFSYLFYLYPLIMCFVVTYTSDHYVIDMIGGAVYAVVAIIIAKNYSAWFSRIKLLFKRLKHKRLPQNSL